MSKRAFTDPKDRIILALDVDNRKAAEAANRIREELKAVTLA